MGLRQKGKCMGTARRGLAKKGMQQPSAPEPHFYGPAHGLLFCSLNSGSAVVEGMVSSPAPSPKGSREPLDTTVSHLPHRPFQPSWSRLWQPVEMQPVVTPRPHPWRGGRRDTQTEKGGRLGCPEKYSELGGGRALGGGHS